jgi:hypothetical protein
MRELLELLGVLAPPAGRREPVALPAWIRGALPVLVAVLATASVLLLALVRSLLG